MESIFMRGRVLPFVAGILLSCLSVFGQQSSCLTSATAPAVHSEGIAERIGDITLTCTGGTAGSTASLSVFVTLNANITNRVDAGNNLQGVTVSVSGGAPGSSGTQQLYSTSTFFVQNLLYTVPALTSTPVIITISGLRAAVALLGNGTGSPIVNATIAGIGATFLTTSQVPVAVGGPTLLTSVINNGIPCGGSPLPATLDFNGFINAGAVSSSIRLTEASAAGFTVRDASSDSGLRFLVNLSGYSAGARAFVPDVIVGSDGTVPTSGGAFNSTVSGGTYQPGSNQLLLVRVSGTDANGAGGNLVSPGATALASFTSVSELSLTGGAGIAVYEVVSSNVNVKEIAQVPIFLVAPQVACTGSAVVPAISVSLAPVSAVVTPTAADPVPRFIAGTPGSDCTQNSDCSATYFPTLSVDTTPINLSGASLGSRQGATITVSNVGSGIVSFTVAATYASGPAFLTITPASGQLTSQSAASLQVAADPSSLQPGTYSASITINGGTYGMFSVPVTFTVGPPGVTISNVLNAATGTSPVAPGSYSAIYGLNLSGQSVSVTFNGFPASVIYDSATQINVVVPAALGSAAAADVVARIDGKTSNSYKTSLALNAPGIFNPGIENPDGSINSASNPAANGSFVAVYLTGLSIPLTGQVTVNIGNQNNLIPSYAGAQPTLPALDQVNVTIPTTLAGTANPVPLAICIPGPTGQPVCSNQANLYVK